MTTTTIVVIVVVVIAAILIIAALTWLILNKRKEHRRVEATGIREKATEQSHEVGQREALADETAAKARAARAEADVRAAQAAGLQERAAAHRSEAVTSRDELTQEFERADKIDPDSQTRDTREESEPHQTPHAKRPRATEPTIDETSR
ncbi:hypothetical protein [Nocardia sp. SYP-A9097]|uniref:hypothetical protein n=1 Tax=Nocardia sp. SYP-A9097 TaxID=2663237 RepID=UPI001E4F1667|nr:hypothetical protein [Nocardia sp. SYP-A9097]